MNLVQNMNNVTIGQIVAGNFRTAEVFKKHSIDFCCKGHRLLSDVCNEKGLDIEVIETELAEKLRARNTSSVPDFSAMEPDQLVDYIERVHHSYVREATPLLVGFLQKVNKVHGKNHPELNDILVEFISCADELAHHMHKEEVILFPGIKRLVQMSKGNESAENAFFFGRFSNPINLMMEEHTTEGDRVARITELSGNFTPPDDACTTYKVAYLKLEEFINDLYTHIHVENNILFPLTLTLEQEIAN